jgi:parallel beta-helix repeat protein
VPNPDGELHGVEEDGGGGVRGGLVPNGELAGLFRKKRKTAMKKKMRYGLLAMRNWMLVVLFGVVVHVSADNFTVSTTADTGVGSLRQAILDANGHAGPDTIVFDIPTTGSLFNSTVWFIEPFSDLPELTDDGTVVDGTTQTARRGDTNADGPEVYLQGYQGRTGHRVSTGITISSSHNVVRGLIVSCFSQTGIWITSDRASYNLIEGNFIGTSYSGADTADSPNGRGILISNGARFNTVGGPSAGERNVISGNRAEGVVIFQSDSNKVIGNRIGTDVYATRALPNGTGGVWLDNAAENDIGGVGEGEGNLISGNAYHGVYITNSLSTGNRIAGNRIGTDANGTNALPNEICGIDIHHGAKHNQIGPKNTICFNKVYGVVIYLAETFGNTITQNSISGNVLGGIELIQDANQNAAPPVLQRTADGVAGTAPPNAMVEIFSDPSDQGMTYEGTATADGSGNFSWAGSPAGPNVTATATDAEGNTSPFSNPVDMTGIEETDGVGPQSFSLSQNFPNPFNPVTTIRFSINKSCRVVLKVHDLLGREVATLVDGLYAAGSHSVRFDASGLPPGIYVCRIRMGDFSSVKKMVLLN